MKRSVSRTALAVAMIAGLWILGFDLLSDLLVANRRQFAGLHLSLAVFTVLILYLLLNQALRARQRAEEALRQTHDELELRVHKRTGELAQANQALQEEIVERARAEKEREWLLTQVEEERLRAEGLANTLEKERDILHTIMENTRTCLAYLDPEFNFVRVNSAYAQGSGHNPEELIGCNHFEWFPNPENQAIFERVRDSSQPVEYRAKPFEYADQPERGVTYWDWTLAPVTGGEGQVQGLVLSLLDVTEQQRAEQALRESEERYHRLFSTMTEAFALHEILCDSEGKPCDYRFLEVNPAFEALTGLKQEGVLGKTVLEVLPGTEAFWIETYGRVALTGEPAHFEQYTGALGRHYQVSAYRPAEKRFACVFTDITERKRAEEAVQRSETLLRAVLDSSPDPIYLKDRDCRLLLANPATFAVVGKPAEAVIGKTDAEFYDDPATGRAIMENDWRIMDSDQMEVVEESVPDPAGTRVYLSTKAPFRDPDGRVIGLIGVARDITERKRAEEALHALNKHLQWQAEELEVQAEELQAQAEELAIANQELSESQERLRLAIEGAGMATWDVDLRTGRAVWSERHFELLGYQPAPDGRATLEMWRSRVHPDDLEQVMAAFERAKFEHGLFCPEYRVVRADNRQIVWLRVFGRFYYDDAGAAVRFMGMFFDDSAFQEAARFIDAGKLVRRKAEPQKETLRPSGLEVMGAVPWGTHFCQFYATSQDLVETLVPYFREGLAANEFCMWVTSVPLQVEQAEAALRAAVPELDDYLAKGQIEILDYREWYTRSGTFQADEVLQGWTDKLATARQRGFEGLRLTGNTFWLEEATWEDFKRYEEEVNSVIGGQRMLALCTYSLEKCGVREILDVIANHQFALIKQAGRWEVIESAEHQQAELSMRESEERLRLAVWAAELGVFEWDVLADRAVWENPRMYEIFGRGEADGPLSNAQLVEEAIHPDDVASFGAALAEGMKPGRLFHTTCRIRRHDDGQLRWVEFSGRFERTPEGAPLRLMCVVGDITERKRAEEALFSALAEAENERRRLEAVMEALPVGVAITDIRGGNIQSNSAYERIWGAPRPEAKSVSDHAAYQAWWVDTGQAVAPQEWGSAQAVQKGEPVVGQLLEIQRFDGARAFVINSAAPVRDAGGKIVGSAVAIQDITELRKAEQALRESQADLKRAQAVAHVGSWRLDIRKGELLWSDETYRIFGVPRDTPLTYQTFLATVHPDDRDLVDRSWTAAMRGEPYDVEHRIVAGDQVKWVRERSELEFDAQGELLGGFGTAQDITQRKQAERLLTLVLEEARQRQVEISALLAATRAVLEHREFKDAARSIFDVCKNLIGATAGYISLLTENDTQNELVFRDTGEQDCSVDPDLPMPMRGLRELAYRTGQAVYENDFPNSQWTRFLPEGHVGLDNALFAPLMVKGIAVGLLGLSNKSDGFSEHDARLAGAFAELAAIALFNSRTLESLEDSEERFRSVAQSASEAIITIDGQGCVLFWNQAAEAMFGYPAEEVIGQPLALAVPERLRAAHREGLTRLTSGGKPRILGKTVEMVGVKKDGGEFPIELSLSAWKIREEMFFTGIIHDITQRKQAEEALRESERKLKILFEILPVGVSILDAALKVTYTNPALERLVDISGEGLISGNHRTRKYLRPDGTPMPAEEFASSRAVKEQREVHNVETGIVKEDGSLIWTNVSAVPVAFPDWKVVIVTTDITERVRAESQREAALEALRRAHDQLELRVQERTAQLAQANRELQAEIAERQRAEEWLRLERNRLKSILDAIPDGVCIVNQEYEVEYVNPVSEREFGPADGRKCYEYYMDRTMVCPGCRNQVVFAGNFDRHEWHSVKTGKTYDLFNAPLRNADGSLTKLEILHDITHRKQMEEDLRSNEERFRQLAENIREVFWITDAAISQMLYISPAYEEIWGRTCQSLYERPTSFLDALHPEDRERVIGGLEKAMRGGYDEQYRILRPDGSLRWIRARAFPIRGEGGQVYRIAGISEDITERALAFQLLEQRVQERTHELFTLLEASRRLASTLDMEQLLEVILDQLKEIVDCTGVTIYKLVGEDFVALAQRGPIPQKELLGIRFSLADVPAYQEAVRHRAPLIIPDVRDDRLLARAFREVVGEHLHTTFSHVRSWMGVPLTIQDRVIGMLGLDHSQPDYYTQQHAELVLTFANQAAMAMENARLYEQGRELATIQERQRLARDLHDAVSQTLFSASLSAEVLPRLWERQPEAGRQCLEELRQLNRGALAEMRTLLLELRPTALTETALGDLLGQLTEAFTSRTRVPVTLSVEGHAPLPPEVQVALYRIAQEALNNAAKHSEASQATLGLRFLTSFPSYPSPRPSPVRGGEGGGVRRVELCISDDGRGFDPQDIPPQRLGVGIMRERAEAIGAALSIESQVGQGTRVMVVWTDETKDERRRTRMEDE